LTKELGKRGLHASRGDIGDC